jgi:hypothetical protein
MQIIKNIIAFLILTLSLESFSQTLDEQASAQHHAFISSHFINYKGDYYSIDSMGSYDWTKEIKQFKGLNIKLSKSLLTEIEKLNKIEYKGVISIQGDAERRLIWYKNGTAFNSSKWSEWEKYIPMEFVLIKKNKQWKILNISAIDSSISKNTNLSLLDQALHRPVKDE